jgi:hypothetical protein
MGLAEVGRQVAGVERSAIGAENDGALDGIAEFAAVARPVVGHHAIEHGGPTPVTLRP